MTSYSEKKDMAHDEIRRILGKAYYDMIPGTIIEKLVQAMVWQPLRW